MTDQLHFAFNEAAKPSPPKRKKKSSGLVSFRVTDAEREALEREAGGKTLSAHIRSVALSNPGKRRDYRKQPDVDRVALARILAMLGHLGLAPDLKVIADAARTGTLECGPELLADLERACRDIMLMRYELIRALGIKAE